MDPPKGSLTREKILPWIQPDLGRPVPFAKIFSFTFDPNHLHILRYPGPHKGAFRDRHGRRVGMRWTRVAPLTRALPLRTAKSCGPDASMVGVKFSRSKLLGDDRDNKARSPGRVRRKPLTPSRAGMPGDPGATVVANACAYYFAHAAAGATGTRHSPLPVWGSARSLLRVAPRPLGAKDSGSNSGAMRGEKAEARVMNTDAPHSQSSSPATGSRLRRAR
jgi:hypothetical protein